MLFFLLSIIFFNYSVTSALINKHLSLLLLLNESKTYVINQLADIVTPVFTTVNPVINKR